MADTFILFDSFISRLFKGDDSLSKTMRCGLMATTTVPNLDTSTIGSIAFAASASGGSATRRVNPSGDGTIGAQFTKTASNAFKFDLSDVVFTATSGGQLSVGVGVVFTSASAIPVGYWQISTALVTASQFTVQWPADGIFETSSNLN